MPDLDEKFIKLRSTGLSLMTVAKSLNITADEALDLDEEHDDEVFRLQQAEIEHAFESRHCNRLNRAHALAIAFKKAEYCVVNSENPIADVRMFNFLLRLDRHINRELLADNRRKPKFVEVQPEPEQIDVYTSVPRPDYSLRKDEDIDDSITPSLEREGAGGELAGEPRINVIYVPPEEAQSKRDGTTNAPSETAITPSDLSSQSQHVLGGEEGLGGGLVGHAKVDLIYSPPGVAQPGQTEHATNSDAVSTPSLLSSPSSHASSGEEGAGGELPSDSSETSDSSDASPAESTTPKPSNEAEREGAPQSSHRGPSRVTRDFTRTRTIHLPAGAKIRFYTGSVPQKSVRRSGLSRPSIRSPSRFKR